MNRRLATIRHEIHGGNTKLLKLKQRIMGMMLAGDDPTVIAERLGLSVDTVHRLQDGQDPVGSDTPEETSTWALRRPTKAKAIAGDATACAFYTNPR